MMMDFFTKSGKFPWPIHITQHFMPWPINVTQHFITHRNEDIQLEIQQVDKFVHYLALALCLKPYCWENSDS